MNQDKFREFVVAASKQAINPVGKIGHLVLTQTVPTGEPEIREPEMRHALAQEAERRLLTYGIEVPTDLKYRFVDATGERKVAARHDFVILEQANAGWNRSILLELKRDQPAMEIREGQLCCPAISKDFQKLLLEQATNGKGLLHILHAADAGTLDALLQKYRVALTGALGASRKALELLKTRPQSCWFTLFILVVRCRGQQGQNRPFLYSLTLDQFGPGLENAQDVFPMNDFRLLCLTEQGQ